MARTFTIKDSNTTINLINTAAAGIIPEAGGFGTHKLIAHQVDEARSIEDLLTVERWKMVTKGSSFANMTTQSRELINLLRNAWRYWNDEDHKDPVYLTSQSTSEASARYALVYQSPEITDPDYFDIDAELNFLLSQGVSIARLPWQGSIPGTLPTAVTLENADGPIGTQTIKPVANELTDLTITHIYNYDVSVTTFGSNLYNSTAWDLFEVSGSTPAAGDMCYIGCDTDRAFKNLLLNIGTAGVYDASIELEYYNGSAWTTLTYGDEFTVWPKGSPNAGDVFDSTGEWWINIAPPTASVAVAINGVTAYWYRFRINTLVSWTTSPAVATYAAWNFKKNYIDISNARILGDAPPVASMRLWAPGGGDENPGMPSLTHVYMGIKSSPGNFESHLNLNAEGAPSGWARSNLTDTGGLVAAEGPRGECVHCTFATDETLVSRVRLTGTARLGDWKGRYRAFIRAQQIGGAAGDTSIRLRTYIDASDDFSPKWDTPVFELLTADEGPELISLGDIKIPFIDYAQADVFTNANLIFEVQAKRDAGAGTLRLYDLILIPADEWTSTLYALIADTTNAPSALRTNNVVEDDGGVLINRTIKYIDDAGVLYPAAEWGRGGIPIKLPLETAFRIYFLMAHKPLAGAWSDNYLMSYPGAFLKFQLFTQPYYLGLRG